MIPHHSPLWKVAAFEVEAERFVPEAVRGLDPYVPEGTDLAIWTWEEYGPRGVVYYGIAYQGKSNKPIWDSSFRTEAQRQARIDETVETRKSVLKYKQEQLEERRNFAHGFQVGDILSSSWGYDQTNVNFYEVFEAGIKEVIVRKITKKVVRRETAANYVVPVEHQFVGPALRRRPSATGIKINDSERATKWNGKPQYETASGWGH